jgi:hypothetical protein
MDIPIAYLPTAPPPIPAEKLARLGPPPKMRPRKPFPSPGEG